MKTRKDEADEKTRLLPNGRELVDAAELQRPRCTARVASPEEERAVRTTEYPLH